MSGVVQERKDKVLLFILSLPVSTTQYAGGEGRWRTRSRSSVPWLVLTAGAWSRSSACQRSPTACCPFLDRACSAISCSYYCVLLGGRAGHRLDRLARDGDHRRQHLGQLPDPVPASRAVGRRASRRRRRRSGPPTSSRSWRSRSRSASPRSASRSTSARAAPISSEEPSCPATTVCTPSTPFAPSRCCWASCSTPAFSFIPGMIPGIWAIDRQLAEHAIERAAVRVAHLPDVAVLLRRRLLRADDVPAQGRARLLGQPRQADPRAAARRLGRRSSRRSPRCGSGA